MTYVNGENHHNANSEKREFIIGKYIPLLEPNPKEKRKYQCPICNGMNLGIGRDSLQYKCFNGCDTKDISRELRTKYPEVESLPVGQYDSPPITKHFVKHLGVVTESSENTQRGTQHSSSPSHPRYPINTSSQPSKRAMKTQKPQTHHHAATYYYDINLKLERYEPLDKNSGYKKYFISYHANTVDENNDPIWIKKDGSYDWPYYGTSKKNAQLEGYVVVVEGEKKVDALAEYYVPAITFKGSNWEEEHILTELAKFPNSLPVVINPDRDDTGKEKGELVAQCCKKLGKDYRFLPMSTFDDTSNDVVDWLDEVETTMNSDEIQALLVEKIQYALKANLLEQCLQLETLSDKVKTWKQLKNQPNLLLERKWLVNGLIPQGEVVVLSALPKVGKSLLAYDLTRSVLQGTDFLGRETAKGKVMWLQLDESIVDMAERVTDLELDDENEDNLIIQNTFSYKEDIKTLSSDLEILKPNLLVIDCLTSFLGEHDLNSAKDMKTVFRPLVALAQQWGITVVIIHHNVKSKEAKGNSKLRGSNEIAAATWASLVLGETPDGNLQLEVISRSLPRTTLILQRDIEGLRHKCLDGDQLLPVKEKSSATGEKILSLLANANDGLTAKEIAEKLGIENKTVNNTLTSLKNQGKVEKRFLGERKPMWFLIGCTPESESLPPVQEPTSRQNTPRGEMNREMAKSPDTPSVDYFPTTSSPESVREMGNDTESVECTGEKTSTPVEVIPTFEVGDKVKDEVGMVAVIDGTFTSKEILYFSIQYEDGSLSASLPEKLTKLDE